MRIEAKLLRSTFAIAAFLLVACGGDEPQPVDAGTDLGADAISDAGDTSDLDTDLDTADPDTSDVADTDAEIDVAEVGDDADVDSSDIVDEPDVPIVEIPVPHDPPAFENPYVDVPFLQEFNHTTNEVELGIGPLVDVVPRPSTWTEFDEATQVTPRAIVSHVGGVLTFTALPEAATNIIGAGSVDAGYVLATSDELYLVTAVDTVTEISIDSMAPTSVHQIGDQVVVLDADAVHVVDPAGALTTIDVIGVENVALGVSDGGDAQWVVVRDGELLGYALGIDNTPTDWTDPEWTLSVADGMLDEAIDALVLDVTLPIALDVVVIGAETMLGIQVAAGVATVVDVAEFAPDRVPFRNVVEASNTSDGGFIAVGSEGAYRVMDRGHGNEWRIYPAERWLPSENVRGVLTNDGEADSPIYFATALGLASVTAQRMTLEDKLEAFVERIVLRHDRDGAVADSHLPVRGDVSSSIPWDSDNDGGWTAHWLLAECFRYQVTGAEDARANFDHSLQAMLNLQTLTGSDTFLARAVIRRDGCMLDDCDDPDDGEWFLSEDGEWWVKGDTSNDEVTSHIWMMGPAYDLCATPEQQDQIRQHVDRIVGGIVDGGYQLLDLDGEVTRYGQFDPDYVNGIVGRISDGGHRSTQTLALLNFAYYVTGDERYRDAKYDLIDNHGYADNAVAEITYPLRAGERSGDSNELGTQGWYILLQYETDPALLERWREGWGATYEVLRQQQGAYWDVINQALGGFEPDISYAARWLRLAPADMIRWSIHQSHRRDLIPAPAFYEQDNGGMRSDGFIFPYDERKCDRWNTDQFRVNGGFNAFIEMDGADVLGPYWMARYYGMIVPE